MNEKALSVLEQYELEINGTYRTKGNYGCDSANGKYILQEYNNSNDKMITMKLLYNRLEDAGFATDYVIPNKEGNYVSLSEDGYTYILKKWYDAVECSVYNEEQILSTVNNLAKFHKLCQNTNDWWEDSKGLHTGKNILRHFSKHNTEIIQIRNYIKKRKNKNYFEMALQKIIDSYYEQGVLAVTKIEQSKYSDEYDKAIRNKSINHGSFNHHNIMFDEEKIIFINLTKVNIAPQIQDLYDFLRKIMEKNEWKVDLGYKILNAYDKYFTISDSCLDILKAMLCYPEKFWKIINYYYNSNKAWYSEKNEDKLIQFQKQEKNRWHFIKNI